MNWTKNLYQLLLSLLIIVNLTISFDFSPFNQTQGSISKTELLSTKKNSDGRIVRFDVARKQLIQQASEPLDWNKSIWTSRLISIERNTSTGYKIQRNSLLGYTFSLQNRLLNDIIQQNSYRG